MKKILIIVGTIIVLLIGGFYAFNAYIYNEEQADTSAFNLGTYGYRCQDGTEFTMSPNAGMDTILIVPATSVERIPKTIISKVDSVDGAKYEGDGITFFAHGETVVLSTDTFTTTCSPMQIPDEAPFNFGD